MLYFIEAHMSVIQKVIEIIQRCSKKGALSNNETKDMLETLALHVKHLDEEGVRFKVVSRRVLQKERDTTR